MKTPIVCYHIAGRENGDYGQAYTYILAGNGLWITAQKEYLVGSAQVSSCQVRGLPPFIKQQVMLPEGLIPGQLWDEAIDRFKQDPSHEAYCAVVWNGNGYNLAWPEQEATAASVQYTVRPAVVCDIHSHGVMGAFFSGTDDRDDQGFRLSVVAGKLDQEVPEARIRVGVYGHFSAGLWWNDVFADPTRHTVDILTDSLLEQRMQGLMESDVADVAGFRVPLLDRIFRRR